MDRERQIQRVRRRILELARDENIESDVLIAALSDVIGDVAVALDGRGLRLPIEERLASVTERSRQTYGRMTMQRLTGVNG